MLRTCWKCGIQVEWNTNRGRSVCDDCRSDRRRLNYHKQARRITCATCGVEWSTRGSNLVCFPCRHRAAKHPCANCGSPCDKRATICMACLMQSPSSAPGPGNRNWRGGKTKHVINGYVRIKVPGHPRAGTDGYMREHQFVMEQHLGRYLLPGENVHHKNGVKDDNRIENLELWVKTQPAGQRASDMLAWAREIIETYEPVELKLF